MSSLAQRSQAFDTGPSVKGDVDEVEDSDRARFSAQPSLLKSASHSTVGAHSQDHADPEKGKVTPDGLGESALPEDKREEAIERAEQDWDVDPENPRNWSFGVKWRMAGIVSCAFPRHAHFADSRTGVLLLFHLASL